MLVMTLVVKKSNQNVVLCLKEPKIIFINLLSQIDYNPAIEELNKHNNKRELYLPLTLWVVKTGFIYSSICLQVAVLPFTQSAPLGISKPAGAFPFTDKMVKYQEQDINREHAAKDSQKKKKQGTQLTCRTATSIFHHGD
ncbi:hypothetical protein JD844_028709 [Phrynosoma platyrhinos]|uniref:Uncharacterized protein n=1 Tax=Phrynosoma platyrhinos TaxID=52577 RepID=A0ABQ7SIG7_PHRPL|nr:hypothetical protein JD844_028709 [Phrynosoma platyrhinos]